MAANIHHDPAADNSGAYQTARLDPERTALVAPDGTEVTYAELIDTANRVANGLRDRGVEAGDVIASLQKNSVQHFEVLMGSAQIGTHFLPVSTHLTASELEYILEDSDSKVLFATKEAAEKVAGIAGLPEHRFVTDGTLDGWGDFEDFKALAVNGTPADRVTGSLMCYTSGTTGKPKAVKRSLLPITPELRAMASVGAMAQYGMVLNAGVQLLISPVYHAAPCNMTFNALDLGHTVVIHEKFDPEAALAAIEKHRVTGTNAVPTQMHRLYSLEPAIREKYDTSSLTNILVAGAPFSRKLKDAILEWLGPVVWEYLAATEGMTSIVTPQEALERPGTVGRPRDVQIVNDDGEEVGLGEVGVIYFKLEIDFQYHKAPEKTVGALREGGYATAGDMGYLDEDGYLFIMDRRVDLIISGGVNVYPAEVEQQLEQHPAVDDVAVVGVSDEEWGQRVVAVVQPAPGFEPGDLLTAELQAFCREGLAGAKIPRAVTYVDSLPRNDIGKLLRRKVRDQLEEENAYS